MPTRSGAGAGGAGATRVRRDEQQQTAVPAGKRRQLASSMGARTPTTTTSRRAAAAATSRTGSSSKSSEEELASKLDRLQLDRRDTAAAPSARATKAAGSNTNKPTTTTAAATAAAANRRVKENVRPPTGVPASSARASKAAAAVAPTSKRRVDTTTTTTNDDDDAVAPPQRGNDDDDDDDDARAKTDDTASLARSNMELVNRSLRTLASLAPRNCTTATPRTASAQVDEVARACAGALHSLRLYTASSPSSSDEQASRQQQQQRGGSRVRALDTERAAASLVANLIELDRPHEALDELRAIRARLLALLFDPLPSSTTPSSRTTPEGSEAIFELLSYAVPSDSSLLFNNSAAAHKSGADDDNIQQQRRDGKVTGDKRQQHEVASLVLAAQQYAVFALVRAMRSTAPPPPQPAPPAGATGRSLLATTRPSASLSSTSASASANRIKGRSAGKTPSAAAAAAAAGKTTTTTTSSGATAVASAFLSVRQRAERLCAVARTLNDGGGMAQWRDVLDDLLLRASSSSSRHDNDDDDAGGDDDERREAAAKVASLARDKADAMLKGAFATVLKACLELDDLSANADDDAAPEPELLLQARFDALHCVLRSRALFRCGEDLRGEAGATSGKLDAIVDQARRALLVYGRACDERRQRRSTTKSSSDDAVISTSGHGIKPDDDDDDCGAEICRRFFVFHEALQSRLDVESDAAPGAGTSLYASKAFGALLELVQHAARRTGDADACERIADLLAVALPCTSSLSSGGGIKGEQQQQDVEARATQLGARLASASSALDQARRADGLPLDTDAQVALCEKLERARRSLDIATILRCSATTTTTLSPALGRLDKEIERLRASATRFIRRDRRLDELMHKTQGAREPQDEVHQAVWPLLDATLACVAKIQRHIATDKAQSGMLEQFSQGSVDTILVLAYADFSLHERETHTRTLARLEQSIARLGVRIDSDNTAQCLDAPDARLVRYTASAFYNIGGTLYNASRPDQARPFVERACALTELAVQHAPSPASDVAALEEHHATVDDLRRQLPKRLELCALCLHAIGDKRAACNAYVKAVVAQGASGSRDVAATLATSPVHVAVERHAALYKLVSRATKLHCFDLLSAPLDASLASRLGASNEPPSVVAALLELQLYALKAFGARAEVSPVVDHIILDLLAVYEPAQHPLRRARCRVYQLERACCAAAPDVDACHVWLQEALSLCKSKNLAEDVELAKHVGQIKAMALAWSALAVHRARQGSSRQFVRKHAEQALAVLEDVAGGELEVSPTKNAASAAPSPEKDLKRSLKASQQARTSRLAETTAKDTYRTPARPTRRQVRAHESPASPPQPAVAHQKTSQLESSAFYDLDMCAICLRTLADVLGCLGLIEVRIGLLRLLRRLPQTTDGAWLETTTALAAELLPVGKISAAAVFLAQIEARVNRRDDLDKQAVARYHLIRAEYLVAIGAQEQADHAYEQARALAAAAVEKEASSNEGRLLERLETVQRCAHAADSFFRVRSAQGDFGTALVAAQKSLRTWTRASSAVARHIEREQVEPIMPSATQDVFVEVKQEEKKGAAPQRRLGGGSAALNQAAWVFAARLFLSTLQMAQVHLHRGNPKFAVHFAREAQQLAEQLGSEAFSARAYAFTLNVNSSWGRIEDAKADLAQLEDFELTDLVENALRHQCRAELLLRTGSHAKAGEAVLLARDGLARAATALEGIAPPPASPRPAPLRRSSSSKVLTSPHAPLSTQEVAHPTLASAVLLTLLATATSTKRYADASSALELFARHSSDNACLARELHARARHCLDDAVHRVMADPLLSVAVDATLALPAFGQLWKAPSSPNAAAMSAIRDAERDIARALALRLGTYDARDLRLLTLLVSDFHLTRSAMTRYHKTTGASDLARVLNLGSATSLRREMLDSVETRLQRKRPPPGDDLAWPCISADGGEHTRDHALRERYRNESLEVDLTDKALSRTLPRDWLVVSVNLAADRRSVYLTRQRRGADPVVFKIALERMADREGDDEDSTFTFDSAAAELAEIVELSNIGTQRAKDVGSDRDDRAAWWRERKELDARLQALCESVDSLWLGMFKAVFQLQSSPTGLQGLKTSLERMLRRCLATQQQDRRAVRIKMDDEVLLAVAQLSLSARDEDFEDLFHFMLDSLSVSGAPVAADEIDLDQAVCDLRAILEDYRNQTNPDADAEDVTHVCLVLDKHLQPFPWEALPCLRKRSVSRLPSVSFLQDRLDMLDASSASGDLVVNLANAAFVLNPGADLRHTSSHFTPLLNDNSEHLGWKGTAGRIPSEEEMRQALSQRDLFLYFGHGGAEQYIRSQTLRGLERCAVTMLWGCSSGHLKTQGDFDPTGTPYHYMIAGCPALVGNLWDVTDKDIDKLSMSVFEKLMIKDPQPGAVSMSLTRAIADSREVCTLKYLNGAAPVVYGIPVRFTCK